MSIANKTEVSLEMLKVGKYYNLFFYSGMSSLVICGVLIAFLFIKKYYKFNPVGIMFNMLLI